MKPILVNNQQEWLRLAPVLEKQGWIWCNGGEKPTKWGNYIPVYTRRK